MEASPWVTILDECDILTRRVAALAAVNVQAAVVIGSAHLASSAELGAARLTPLACDVTDPDFIFAQTIVIAVPVDELDLVHALDDSQVE